MIERTISYSSWGLTAYPGLGKRLVDIGFTILLGIITSPGWILIPLVLSFTGRNPIYFQTRIGLDRQPFSMIKFRTMMTDGDYESANSLQIFLRATHLDELPQLLNVILGHMSLVGPRPLPVEYLSFMSGSEIKRHQIQPGITGLVQVGGGNSLSWESRFALDLEYVSKSSLGLDLKIMFKTLRQIINSTSLVANPVRLDEIRASVQTPRNG